MKHLFGVANNSVYTLAGIVQKVTGKQPTLVLTRADIESGEDVLFFASVTSFLAVQSELNSLDDAVVFLFDNPVRLECLDPIEVLDVKERSPSYLYSFVPLDPYLVARRLKKVLATDKTVDADYTKDNVLPNLLRTTSDSTLHYLQGFFYSLKDVDMRESVRRLIMTWFVNDVGIDRLKAKILAKLNHEPGAALNRLMSNADSLTSLQKAMLQIKRLRGEGKAVSYDKIAEKCEVSAFDLRYIASVLRRIQYDVDLTEQPLAFDEISKMKKEGTDPLVSTRKLGFLDEEPEDADA